MNKFFVLISGLLLLSACGSLHYENGQSLNDVPANVHMVNLKDVYMVDRWTIPEKNEAGVKNDPLCEPDPSKNDQEITAMVKAAIMKRLSNLGFAAVENPGIPADVEMKFFIDYQPEAWPLMGRVALITSRVYAADGTPLFSVFKHDQNVFGLLGVVLGDSRDNMVTALAQKVVDETAQEVRKGKKRMPPMPLVINHLN